MNQNGKRLSKMIALMMALVLLMSAFSGCKLPDNTVNEPITIESSETDAPQDAEETPLPEPTFQVSDAAESAFHALDLEVFRWFVTSDGYSLHMFVDNPANYQIDHASVKMTLGEFTEEDNVRIQNDSKAFLEKLDAINREDLIYLEELYSPHPIVGPLPYTYK